MNADFIAEFVAAMTAAGMPPDVGEIITADDTIHAYRSGGGKRKSFGYKLKIEDSFAVGWFHSHKTGETIIWHSRSRIKMDAEQRKRMNERLKVERQAQEVELARTRERAALQAGALYGAGIEGEHPYLARKGIKAHIARVNGEELIIPVWIGGVITSAQRITADGDKFFIAGGAVKGGCCWLGEHTGAASVILAEGYATGATLHEAMGLPVCVAFNAGNMPEVAKRLAKMGCEVIIAADNDCWGERNAGMEGARAAAAVIGEKAVVKHPVFARDYDDKPTDFNDLYLLEGVGAVMACLAKEECPPPVWDDAPPAEEDKSGSDGWPFRILGHDEESYYYHPEDKKQVVALTRSQHTLKNLFGLATYDFWSTRFGMEGTSNSKIETYAANALIAISHRTGVFKMDMLRGVGAWLDEGRNILHGGDVVYIDGEATDPYQIRSRYVYQAGARVFKPASEGLRNAEAIKLREICEGLSWENKLSGSLLAGWCVVAPVCAMLPWRPHIWVTGEAQAGKTTVLKDIIKPVVGPMAVMTDGGTTEASLRGTLRHDGRPVIYDEAEAESMKDSAIMEGVMMLARKSSSGGVIMKGTANGDVIRYQARSAFCFSGINPSVKHRADESRVSMLVMKRDRADGCEERYAGLKDKIAMTITPDYCARLITRTVANLGALLDNCATFTNAAAVTLGDRRAADQIGAMLAGLYLLGSTGRVSFEAAKEWITKHDWTLHTAIDEASDPERLVEKIANSSIRVGTENYPIASLLERIVRDHELVIAGKAIVELRAHGIVVEPDGVYIANNSSRLGELLRGTPWASKWSRSLGDIPGAAKVEKKYFSAGLRSRAVRLPLEMFIGGGAGGSDGFL